MKESENQNESALSTRQPMIVLVDMPTDPLKAAQLNEKLDEIEALGYTLEIGAHPKPRP